MPRWLSALTGLACLVPALFFAFVFYERYWRWRNCFNELGRCWDSESEQVFLEQAGIIWGGFTLLFLVPALLILWRARADQRR